jgi:hypothetical protein
MLLVISGCARTFSIISDIYVLFNYSELGIILNFIVLSDSVYIRYRFSCNLCYLSVFFQLFYDTSSWLSTRMPLLAPDGDLLAQGWSNIFKYLYKYICIPGSARLNLTFKSRLLLLSRIYINKHDLYYPCAI